METPHNAPRRWFTKPCADCGTIIEADAPNRKYCDECRLKRRRKREAGYAQAKRERNRERKRKLRFFVENHHEISLVAQAAREAGMTYGKYTAMLRTGGKV